MTIILSAVGRIGLWGFATGLLLGGLYGGTISLMFGIYGPIDPVETLLGAIVGLIVGAGGGGLLGMLDGLLIGVMTRLFFKPPIDSRLYRLAVVVVSTLFGGAGAFIGFKALVGFTVKHRPTVLLGVLAPAFIAGCAAGYAGWRFARWCEGESIWDEKSKKKKRGERAT